MQQIRVRSAQSDVTLVANQFIDHYMPEVNGEFLKVYLYLLRWHNDAAGALTLSAMADRLYMTERDIIRALKYWQTKSLLSLTFEDESTLSEIELCPINGEDPVAATVPAAEPISKTVEEAAHCTPKARPAKRNYSMDEICHFFEDHNEDHLLFVLQQYIGHPLTQTELSTVLFFSDELGFSTDLIEYLFEYCVSIHHQSIHYIEKVAINWSESGIRTVAQAKAQSSYFTKTDYAVLKAFGITGRKPVEQEVTAIRRWTDDYGFSTPMILEACSRTMAAIHNPSFDYTDKILKNWHSQKIFSTEDLKQADIARKEARKIKDEPKKPVDSTNRFNRFEQRSYDYESLEQKLARKLNQTNQL